MRLITLIFLALFGASVSAAEFLCGSTPCEEVSTQAKNWPGDTAEGVPVQVHGLSITVPTGFDAMRLHERMVTYVYPPEEGKNKQLYLFTITINKGERGGPEGGWETLYRSERDGLVAYYFRDPTGSARHVGLIRNVAREKNDPLGRITYLQFGSEGLSETEFLRILGSVKTEPGSSIKP